MPIHHPHLFSPSTHHSQASTTHFPCCPKKLQDALSYYRIQKYIEQKFVFSRTWKPCIHLKNCFMGSCIGMMVTYSSNFNNFQCMVTKKFASITFSHFCIFSLSMHPFKKRFHGEMHIDDGNMPKQFQPIPVHSFQEIDLHHLQPFSVFLEIHASIDQNFPMGCA